MDLLVNGFKLLALVISSVGLLVYNKIIFKKWLKIPAEEPLIMAAQSSMIEEKNVITS